MKIGFSSANFYPGVNTEDSLKIISDLGFSVAEIFLNSFSEYEESFINKIKEESIKNNIEINSIHAFSSSFEPFIFDRYKRRRDDMLTLYRKVCKACSMLGVKIYNFHGMRKMDNSQLDMKFIVDIYSELAYIALENEIYLTQENVSWCMCSELSFLKTLKEEIKYPMKYTIDLKQAYRANVEPKQYIEIMGEDIINLHINDKNQENFCLLPGKGDIDYRNLFELLKEYNYKGNAIIEVYKENFGDLKEIIDSKLFLENLLK